MACDILERVGMSEGDAFVVEAVRDRAHDEWRDVTEDLEYEFLDVEGRPVRVWSRGFRFSR